MAHANNAVKETSLDAKRLLNETARGAGETIKIMFAANKLLAEDILNRPRGEVPVTQGGQAAW
jgi:hypothetical protein